MVGKKTINDFAIDWQDRFIEKNISDQDLVDDVMTDELMSLGFDKDSEKDFLKEHEEEGFSIVSLKKFLKNAKDIPLLLNAIYSKWKFLCHYPYDSEEMKSEENREWFIETFNRLKDLTADYEKIKKIEINYHSFSKILTKDIKEKNVEIATTKEGKIPKFIKWDYKENLVIDGEKEIIKHHQSIGKGCKIKRQYSVKEGIKALLDCFDAEDLFTNIIGNPDDIIVNKNEKRTYKIKIQYEKSPEKILEGTFDKNGLPDDFYPFAETVFSFINFYGLGEILNPTIFGKAKRRNGQLIYLSVSFNDEDHRTYYYLTDDDTIEVGDPVLVPARQNDYLVIAQVVKVEYFFEEEVPFPLSKTKKIIRKCTDGDFQ